VWDPVEHFWEERFREFVAYKREHGDCLVPRNWKSEQLALWVHNLRRGRKTGVLGADKIKRLDQIGFVWDSREQAWEDRFKELVAYKQVHRDCLVPITWKNKQLATWVHTLRRGRKTGVLSADKIKRLDQVGFVWDPFEQAWGDRFKELVAYKLEHGDCLVPRNWKNKQLATWVHTLRRRRKTGILGADKIKRLDALGFVWDVRK
jgi:hypothetical protein